MDRLPKKMQDALRLTVQGKLADASSLLQRSLAAGATPAAATAAPASTRTVADPAAAESTTVPAASTAAPGKAGGRFLSATFSNESGTRAYKLYVPGDYHEQSVPLVVMLHGCSQSPDDFAAGTQMNALAEESTFLVVYPEQSSSANASKCWNWFKAGDQVRGRGEPSLVAGITRHVMRQYTVDPERVYVAGLSAGGAAAAVLGAVYPELFAAVGIHSGLACGAAHDLSSALVAMRGGDPASPVPPASSVRRAPVPTIVFHGDRDGTVHQVNSDRIVAQSFLGDAVPVVSQGRSSGGLAYTRRVYADARGREFLEQWTVHGAGHAWSGGSRAGSYTDPRGPDASREMIRFFLRHPGA